MGNRSRTALATSTAFDARPAEHGHHHRRAGLRIAAHPEPHVDALVLHACLRAGDIFQVDGRAVAFADDQVVVLLGVVSCPCGWSRKLRCGPSNWPGAGVAGAVLDRVGQIFQRDVADRHRRGIGLDAHRRLRAVDRNLAHARQNADALADLRVGVVVELAVRHRVADQRDVHDRLVVRVRLGERGRAGQIDGQAVPERA